MAAPVAMAYAEGSAPGEVEASVRAVLAAVLDTPPDRPLAGLAAPGATVVVKPNMVRHFNPRSTLDAVVTSPVVVRAAVAIAADAVGRAGRVVVADSPQNDCDFGLLLATEGWAELHRWAEHACPGLEVLDMRPEQVEMADGVVTARHRLPGDPMGEVEVDLGGASAFTGSDLRPERLRGSDYDPSVTRSSHSDGRHRYSLCRTFLAADLLIVVPKVKTHKKVGLSLAMKNLVGLVGDKNRLPHHTAGFPGRGGDEYPRPSARALARHWAIERARPLLARGRLTRSFRALRRLEDAALPEVVARSGNWWGNDTAWRMALDLVAALRQERLDRGRPTLFLYDGLVVGEGEGPLGPEPVQWDLLAASTDPAAGDLAVARELGLDPARFPIIVEALERGVWSPRSAAARLTRVSDARPGRTPRLHPGWEDAPVRRPVHVLA